MSFGADMAGRCRTRSGLCKCIALWRDFVLRYSQPSCDDAFKAAAYLVEAARSTGTAGSAGKQSLPALNLALGFKEPVFQHWSTPEHAWRGKRMGQAMKQLHQMANGNVVTGKCAILRFVSGAALKMFFL